MLQQYVWAVLAALLCLAGAITQLAVHRSPDVPDSDSVRAARRITVIALLLVFIYMTDLIMHQCVISPVMSILFGFFGAAQTLYAYATFSKHTRGINGSHASTVR